MTTHDNNEERNVYQTMDDEAREINLINDSSITKLDKEKAHYNASTGGLIAPTTARGLGRGSLNGDDSCVFEQPKAGTATESVSPEKPTEAGFRGSTDRLYPTTGYLSRRAA